ncbi:hypothetical protein FL966_01705 [Caproiciproducens galactitolivorans]|nr:hypothetical protein [Caproiciproducens galactitolivorans]QEY33860.1 hypothetical protein FL966_01705 [Caproiciproducens galactitolivorans]
MIRFTIPYITPQIRTMKQFCRLFGLNAIYAGKHWAQRKKDAEYWHLIVTNCLSCQNVPHKPNVKPVTITFWWNDRMDCSNHAYAAKMIEDAMKGWVIKDDSRRYVKEIRHKFYDGDCIAVEVNEA